MLTLELSRRTLTEAARQGWSAARLWEILEQEGGPPPPPWRAVVDIPQPAIQIQRQMAVLTAAPALLARAGQARSVRRYLHSQLAPGVALVQPEHVASLQRALERQHVACISDTLTTEAAAVVPGSTKYAPTSAGRLAVSAVQHPGDWAALLVACAFYRRHAPPQAPLIPHAELEARLAAQLPPVLRHATETALAALDPTVDIATETAPTKPLPQAEAVRQLRIAQERRLAVTILYNTADNGAWTRRMVRPLALERRGATWYLRAYCLARSAERTFRVDRIGSVAPG
jgi:hypothetical protein